jgi:hypothetical protein
VLAAAVSAMGRLHDARTIRDRAAMIGRIFFYCSGRIDKNYMVPVGIRASANTGPEHKKHKRHKKAEVQFLVPLVLLVFRLLAVPGQSNPSRSRRPQA